MKLIVAGMAAAAVLAGCTTEQGQASAATCVGVNAMESTASAVIDDASSTITVKDAKQALAALDAAYGQLADDIRQAAPSVSKQFEDAEKALQVALADAAGSATLSEAGAQVDTARKDLRQVYAELVSAMGC